MSRFVFLRVAVALLRYAYSFIFGVKNPEQFFFARQLFPLE
jgi:hypothetical protein